MILPHHCTTQCRNPEDNVLNLHYREYLKSRAQEVEAAEFEFLTVCFEISGAVYPRVKRPGCEAEHSPSPSTEVKNAWRY
jgi:hypothetical protein